MKIKSIIILIVFTVFCGKGAAMTFLFFGGDKLEATIFSPLEGKLTYQGKPASGAKIKLWLAWKDQEGESEIYTVDADGYFSLPEKKIAYQRNPLAQISIGQTITVEYQGQEILIWKAGKTSTHLYGELGGRPEGVTCELSREDSDAYFDHSLLETTCVWRRINKALLSNISNHSHQSL